MLKAVAIDDEPLALSIIESYVKKSQLLELLATFSNATEAASFIAKNPVDLIFLDINMPDVSGVDFAAAHNHAAQIIFTTAHKEYAVDGFELSATDYLLKPFSLERFEKAVSKAIVNAHKVHGAEPDAGKSIFVYANYQHVKIALVDIRFLESLDDYVKIHFTNGKTLLTLSTLKKISAKLPQDIFKRIHRRYIMNLQHIIALQGRKVIVKGQVEIPIGENYLGALDEWKSGGG